MDSFEMPATVIVDSRVDRIEKRITAIEQTLSDRAPLLDKLTETISALNEILEKIGEK